MKAQPVFCCGHMAMLFSSGKIRLRALSNQGHVVASIGSFDEYIPLNYWPSCGREFCLPFLTDSEVQ